MLHSIVSQVNDPRLGLCLDVGHVNAYSAISAREWIDRWEGFLSHAHLHNNDGSADTHSALWEGTLELASLMEALPTDATATLELPEIGGNLTWLEEKGLLTRR